MEFKLLNFQLKSDAMQIKRILRVREFNRFMKMICQSLRIDFSVEYFFHRAMRICKWKRCIHLQLLQKSKNDSLNNKEFVLN